MSWRHFKPEEFACKCGCGEQRMSDRFVQILDDIRESTGIAMVITSGYRCTNHPIEAAKQTPGPHSTGRAADIAVWGADAYAIVDRFMYVRQDQNAGIGFKQHGDISQRFIHLDICEPTSYRPRPHLWSYP